RGLRNLADHYQNLTGEYQSLIREYKNPGGERRVFKVEWLNGIARDRFGLGPDQSVSLVQRQQLVNEWIPVGDDAGPRGARSKRYEAVRVPGARAGADRRDVETLPGSFAKVTSNTAGEGLLQALFVAAAA